MPERVSTLEVRQRIGDLLSRVALRRGEFIIERKGKPLAALMPVERLEQMCRFARRHALEAPEPEAGGPCVGRVGDRLGARSRAPGTRGKRGAGRSAMP
jgi:hypothetical protein